MRLLLVIVLATVGLSVVYPLYAERTQSPCDAFEQRARRLETMELAAVARRDPRLQQLLALVPGDPGMLAASYARRTFPILPPQLACMIGYWQTVLDPGAAGSMMMPGRP